MVKIIIPTALRQYTEGTKSQISISAKTVSEALATLLKENQRLAKHIVDEQGNIRNFVNIFLNDEDIRYLKGEETQVKEGDTIRIVPAIAGGLETPEEEEATKKLIENKSAIPDIDERKGTISPREYRRYGRHLIIPEVGMDGQRKLKAAKVLVIGTGGLGAPSSLYLAAAGVGTIGLIDFDTVDETNLHRQILYSEKDIGRSKVQTAKERLQLANPNTQIKTYEEPLTSENALEIFKGYDIIVDGTDNFPTRYLTNDACVMLGKPNVYASIFRFEGQATVFDPRHGGPCYRCLYPRPPPPGLVPSCAEGGVLGVLPGLVGLIQATETIKLIIGKGEPLRGRLLVYDALSMRFDELKIRKNPKCPICSEKPEITKLIDYEAFCGIEKAPDVASVVPTQLDEELKQGKKVLLLDVREPHEYEIVHINGSKLIPLGELAERVSELDSADEIVAYCHTGGRSARATDFLRGIGYKKVRNLEGGVDAWSIEVDPSLPRY